MTSGWGRRLVASAAVLVLIGLAACGKSSDSSSSKTTTTTSTTTAKTGAADARTAAQLAADTSLAKAANLTAADLPAGWSVASSSSSSKGSSSQDKVNQAQLASCLGVDASALNDTKVDESSPSFDKADAEVSSEVEVRPDEVTATKELALIHNSRLPSCFSTMFKQEFEKQATSGDTPGLKIGAVTVKALAFPSMGDDVRALRIEAPATYQGVTIDTFIDIVVIRTGRTVVSMTYDNVQSPFDAAVAEQAARAVVARAKA